MDDRVTASAVQQRVLGTLRVLLRPVVRLSLAHGVKFQQLSELLKVVSLDVAEAELRAEGRRMNASLLSVTTGLHRKDVNRLSQQRGVPEAAAEPSLESQVFTRWITDPAYLDDDARPRPLARATALDAASASTFESLARGVTSDVHPRAILDSLLRLGMVAITPDDRVELRTERFVPSRELERMLAFMRDSNHDHLAAAVANTLGRSPPFLEQSMFADGLTAESANRLQDQARGAWLRLIRQMVPSAERMVEIDREVLARDDRPQAMRLRVGMYFYSEPRPGRPPAGGVGAGADDSEGGERT